MATRLEIQAMIAGIGTGEPNTAAEMRTLLTALLDPPTGTIRVKDVTNAYILSNFDGTGLGINEEVGWALCNGVNSGTRNSQGRVTVNYDPVNYPIMGATGGSKDQVVTEHTHTTIANTNLNYGSGDGISRSRAEVVSAGNGNPINVTVEKAGVSGIDKNMQPYIVRLETVKL